jgi:hypothetical protein
VEASPSANIRGTNVLSHTNLEIRLQADAGKLEGPPEGSLKAFALSQTDFVMLIANQAVLSGQVLPCLLANLTADSPKDDHLVH